MLCGACCACKALHTNTWLSKMQFAILHVKHKMELSTGPAPDPSAEIMAHHYCLLNRMAPQSRLASSPCFGVVVTGCMIWWDHASISKCKLRVCVCVTWGLFDACLSCSIQHDPLVK